MDVYGAEDEQQAKFCYLQDDSCMLSSLAEILRILSNCEL